MAERVDHRWTVGPYTFEAVSRHGFPPEYPEVMYRFKIQGQRMDNEVFASLDRALVAAVGARHMGPRSASGPGVGTAADWFCVMIGLAEEEHQAVAVKQPVPEQPKLCPGRGRRWAVLRHAPACPVCHQRPEDMGAEKPVEHSMGWYGTIPDHPLPEE